MKKKNSPLYLSELAQAAKTSPRRSPKKKRKQTAAPDASKAYHFVSEGYGKKSKKPQSAKSRKRSHPSEEAWSEKISDLLSNFTSKQAMQEAALNLLSEPWLATPRRLRRKILKTWCPIVGREALSRKARSASKKAKKLLRHLPSGARKKLKDLGWSLS